MNSPAFPLRRLLIGIIPSAVTLLLAYLVFNYHQHAYGDLQSKRNFRALNETENQIKSKLDALEEVVFKSLEGVEGGQEYLESLDLLSQSKDSLPSKDSKEQVPFSTKFGNWSPNLQKVFEPLMRLDLFDSVVIAQQ